MIVGKFEPLTLIEVWSPRYHDKVALLHAGRVRNATTALIKVKFTRAKSMEGDWVISKAKAMSCKLDSNGSAPMYAVPLTDLQPLEINERDIRGVI